MSERNSISREAIDHLDLYGYCLIEDLIPADQAEEMEQIYYRHHQDPDNRTLLQNPNVEDNQTLFGVTTRNEEPDRIRREIYERMPPELQELFRYVVAQAGDEISST